MHSRGVLAVKPGPAPVRIALSPLGPPQSAPPGGAYPVRAGPAEGLAAVRPGLRNDRHGPPEPIIPDAKKGLSAARKRARAAGRV
jgi:hypothetical protein